MKRILLILTLLCQLTISVAQQADFQKAVARYKNASNVTAAVTKTTHKQAVAKDITSKGNLTMKRPATVSIVMDGGTLHIEWREADNHVYMTGPAEFVFDSEIEM